MAILVVLLAIVESDVLPVSCLADVATPVVLVAIVARFPPVSSASGLVLRLVPALAITVVPDEPLAG